MPNLPTLNVNNTLPTLADAQFLQRQLIEKLFNSSQVIPDRVYETITTSVSFALDWYINNTVLTNAQLYRLSQLAVHPSVVEGEFIVDYNLDYSDIVTLPDINANKTYVAQTYLADDNVTMKRKLVVFTPITSVGQDIESSIQAEYNVDPVPLSFQSFRFVNLDSSQWGDIMTDVVASYVATFAAKDLLYFEYSDKDSNWMVEQLAASHKLLNIIK